jgi:tetraacyldisaccharide 4'-kinase
MKFWQKKTALAYGLRPLEMVFRCVAAVRRGLYHVGILKSTKFPVPVIVVGNIYIGGTGKTPVVIALVEALKQAGYCPGIVSRGYKANDVVFPHRVSVNDPASMVGDEPLLIARRTQCPVVIAPKRPQAVSALLDKFPACNVIVTDDGLQHYALQRDIEIAVLDADRHFGNGFCLPAGPLREPVSRLKKVDYVITNGMAEFAQTFKIDIEPLEFINVLDATLKKPADFFKKQLVHAVSGIGSPQRFYRTLQSLGLIFSENTFADHHRYTQQDFEHLQKTPIVMTEKDAVKCTGFATESMWYLPISAKIPDVLLSMVLNDLMKKPA